MENIETTRYGWIFICEICNSQTATVGVNKAEYFCQECYDNQSAVQKIDDVVVCECGSEKCGIPHADWCPKGETK